MGSVRLTMAQALVQALSAQWTQIDGQRYRLFAGVWAIFGHGNVAGLGEALQASSRTLPTFRAHNEQAMAHAAIAYAKASRRRRMMGCTTSIGPGATNLTTAAAVAHVNRLPVLLLPGDVFASRRPDPVLQQVEDFGDGLITANDCLRPVSRYFDRIVRPEQLMPALERALQVLTDPAECGPVTLALCQDVQTEAHDWPTEFFREREWLLRRQPAAETDLAAAVQAMRSAKHPVIVCGGGVIYSGAGQALGQFAERYGIPVVETQAGKSALPSSHALNLGGIGVTGTAAANNLMSQADVVLSVGSRLQDFTTGSGRLIRRGGQKIIGLNVQCFDASKFAALPLVADAEAGLRQLTAALDDWTTSPEWQKEVEQQRRSWDEGVKTLISAASEGLPSDAQVIGALQKASLPSDIVVGAAGGLPGDLHKLWQAGAAGGYHLEYGYSCMGYEIAGGLGVKLAQPDREVFVLVGDGSYLMMNSEIATSVQMERRLIVILLDNRGFGCIERLQNATGNASFNNLLTAAAPRVDFVAHARSLGAHALLLDSVNQLAAAIGTARRSDRTSVLVIQTDPRKAVAAGGAWWDVPVPEVSARGEVMQARHDYEARLAATKSEEDRP